MDNTQASVTDQQNRSHHLPYIDTVAVIGAGVMEACYPDRMTVPYSIIEYLASNNYLEQKSGSGFYKYERK